MGTWWKVPRDRPGATAVCLASGPSLTPAVAAAVRRWHAAGDDGDRVAIAISDAYALAPWADVLYSCDSSWWHHHRPAFSGLRVSIDDSVDIDGVMVLKQVDTGMSESADALGTGSNSGFQAVNLAMLMGCTEIVLVGYDMRVVGGRSHFFGEHPEPLTRASPYQLFIDRFRDVAPWLRERGIDVINCTAGSALDCFAFEDLETVLGR